MQKPTGRNRIVLLGVGHTNAHVLRMWKMNPLANTELVCVSNFPVATYSGMLPGVLAGQYAQSEMEIDLVRLCNSAGARLIIDQVTGIDHARNQLLFSNRTPLEFDYLSVGVGSRPSFANVVVHTDERLITIKPMQTFLARSEAMLAELKAPRLLESAKHRKQIVIVGGGVGSIEIAFCLQSRLQSRSFPPCEITLLSASSRIGHQLLPANQSKIERALNQRGIKSVIGRRVCEIAADHLVLDDHSQLRGDLFVWATQAAAPEVIARLDLELDSAGFIATRATLQTTRRDHIFAVGDSASLISQPTPKAGVYAVRQGPVLWDNLQRSLTGQPLIEYQPQGDFLKLINTGDGKSILEYKGLSVHSRWAWILKNRIDSKFMAMFRNYEPPAMMGSLAESSPRCLGCGGKIGSQILSEVLRGLELPSHPDVILGLDKPDDAAIVKTHDQQVTITTDFFASPLNDPELIGRIAVLNSASDLFVMGAQPTAALAMIQVPHGHPRGQTRVMRELMAGSVSEIAKMGAALVGGHSIEGSELTIGFTFLGRQLSNRSATMKGGLNVGDHLILSKPLGTGVLLAALMRSQLPGMAYLPLLATMLQSNQIALTLIEQGLVSTITDVTGFGLAGHLGEMLTASQLSARLHLDQIPRLAQADELLEQGLESTLAPDNRILHGVRIDSSLRDSSLAILFDPQTSGGLLLGASPKDSALALRVLQEHGFEHAAMIGEVTGHSACPVTLEVK